MNIANEVTYAALDPQRQVIPWIRSRSRDGKETIYRSTEIEISDDSLSRAFTRKMDCIDCHNRPTHIYHPPARSVNHVISQGWIDPSLPGVKSISVQALEMPYTTRQAALDSIRQVIEEYYATNHPEVASGKQAEIARTIEETRKIYSRNYFPEMRVSWKKFTDNIGHMYYPGCFRCHDGKHISEDGRVLSRDCNSCHTILAQQVGSETLRVAIDGLEYEHPVEIGDAWKESNCSNCHNPDG
jgi:hypothetical protein